MNKILIEGLDRLGKDTLIQGILNKTGYHHVMHFSKPVQLDCYVPSPTGMTAQEILQMSLQMYQERSFRTMFSILRDAKFSHIICNRAHLGECVYAPLYRGYSGDYVFELEQQYAMSSAFNVKLILLTEDFKAARHFVDDGASLGVIENREKEQELFLEAFEKSVIQRKQVICVTDTETGKFKSKELILAEALS
jgi:thymidylate kinase